MLLSVIIPVYNSSKYIKECINSITKQTYKNIEIIVVDDESTDNSLKICKELAKNDNRIKVFSKKNGGTSSARNFGLKKVSGEYVTFLDNDDYWDNEKVIENIMKQLDSSKADVLLFNTKDYFMNNKKIVNPPNIIERKKIIRSNKNEMLKILLENGLYYRAVWTKIIKFSLIRDNNIVFPEGRRNEDTDFSLKLMLYANSFDYYDKIFHVYRRGHETAQTSHSISVKSLEDMEFILENNIILIENVKDNELKKCLFSYLAYPFCVWMGQVGFFKDKNQRIKRMKKYKYILKYDYDKNVRLSKIMCRIIGFKNTSTLLNIFMRLKYRKNKR